MKSDHNAGPTHQKKENVKKDRIVGYSKNVFLPVTALCRSRCYYYGFRKNPGEDAWVMSEKEIKELVEEGKKSECTKATITLGEEPEIHDLMRDRLDEWGYSSTVEYLQHLSKEILKLGLLPYINSGIVSKKELSTLREYSASIELMLKCSKKAETHKDSTEKNTEVRLKMIENAGKPKIPLTTGILVGTGENWTDRIKLLLEIRKLQEKYRHIQEVIIQPFTPREGTFLKDAQPPNQRDILNTVAFARGIMPHMSIQFPANLTEDIVSLLTVGVDDLGGISFVKPDFIRTEHSWPKLEKLKSTLKKSGFYLKEHLSIHPQYADNPNFMSPAVQKVVESYPNRIKLGGRDRKSRNKEKNLV